MPPRDNRTVVDVAREKKKKHPPVAPPGTPSLFDKAKGLVRPRSGNSANEPESYIAKLHTIHNIKHGDMTREEAYNTATLLSQPQYQRDETRSMTLPSEKPVIPLQKHGVQMGISEVNQRVQDIVEAHQHSFGVAPSPGVVFDLLRRPEAQDYGEIFKLPKSQREAQSFKIASKAELPAEHVSDADLFKKAMTETIYLHSGTPLGEDPILNSPEFKAAKERNPKLATKFQEESIKLSMYYNQPKVQAAGVTQEALDPVFGVLSKGTGQILTSLSDIPYGVYKIAESVVLDTVDQFKADVGAGNKGGFHRSRQLAVGMAKAIADDFRHPLDNPGYLAMDIWTIITAGAGSVTRLGAVGRATGAAAKARALIRRPPAGSFELGWGAQTASVPLFENSAARIVQKAILGARNKRMVKRQIAGEVRGHSWLYDEFFSTERKLTREKQINAQIEFAVAAAPLTNYLKMGGWAARAKAVSGQILSHPSVVRSLGRVSAREKIGIEKAMQVLLTDDPNPVQAWRSFHEDHIRQADAALADAKRAEKPKSGQIRALEYQRNSHKIQLEALSLAEEIINNPSKRFKSFVDETRKVSRAQQNLKEHILGLDPDIAAQAIATTGARVRGQRVIDLGGGKRGITTQDPDPINRAIAKHEAAIDRIQDKLRDEKKTLQLHPQNAEAMRRRVRFERQLASRERALGREQKKLEDLKSSAQDVERVSEDSAYLPFKREVHRPTKLGFIPLPRGRRGRYGSAPPDKPASLRYRNDGTAIEIGDFRWDTSTLLAEEYVATLRAAFATTQYHDLWSIGRKLPTENQKYPIRNVKNAPERLKRVVVAMEDKFISRDAAALMTDPALQELREWAAPSAEKMEELINAGEAKRSDFRFVDDRFIYDRVGGRDVYFWKQMDEFFGGMMTPINEPMRLMLIFLTPAYLLNAGGNAVLAAVKQGPLVIPNMKRALHTSDLYTKDGAAIIDALGGETLTGSLVSEKNLFTKGSQTLMEGWQTITDTLFRRSAIIHELRRRGVLTDDMTPEQALAALKDPANEKARVESARAGRQAMLDFNRMSWPERASLRHFIFIYSFMRASAIYGARFMVEHPIKQDVLAQAGRGREEDLKKMLGVEEPPEWFLRHGYMPTKWGVADPIQFNVPAMLVDMAYPIASLFSDVPYSSPGELASPAAKAFGRLATGRDEQGRELPGPGGRIGKTFLSLAQESPLGYMRKREQREAKERPLPEPPIASGLEDPASAAMARERAALDHGSFEADTFNSTWGRVLFRSALPLDIEKEALAARGWRDLRENDPEKYIQHQVDRVNQMLGRQAKVMGMKSAPPDVKDAVNLVARIGISIENWRNDLEKSKGIVKPTETQVGLLVVDELVDMGRLTEGEAKDARKRLMAARTEKEAKKERMGLMWNAGGKAWQEWHEKVGNVLWFDTQEYNVAIEDMNALSLGNYETSTSAKRPDKWAYGRAYETFQEESDAARERASQFQGRTGVAAEAEYRLWLEQQDKPVVINGKTFPSAERMEHLKRTPEGRAAKVMATMTGTWASTSAFDRELVGKKPPPGIMGGWLLLRQQQDKVDDGSASYERDLAIAINKAIPGFLRDYDFHKAPLAGRMKEMKPITSSPHSAEWQHLLTTAEAVARGMKDRGYNETETSEFWAEQGVPAMRSWIATTSPGFRAELSVFEDGYDHFIEKLVK